jgi:hypothetical protein
MQQYNASCCKTSYQVETDRSRILDSGYFENQTWRALHKAGIGCVIGKYKYGFDRIEYYAEVILKLQREARNRSLFIS